MERESMIFDEGSEGVQGDYEATMAAMRALNEQVNGGVDYLGELEQEYRKVQGVEFAKHIR